MRRDVPAARVQLRGNIAHNCSAAVNSSPLARSKPSFRTALKVPEGSCSSWGFWSPNSSVIDNKEESVYWLWMCSYCCAYFVWSLICDIINYFQVSSFTFKCCNSDLCNSAPSSATSSVIGVLASLAVMWWCIHWRATWAALRCPPESSLTTAASHQSQYWCSLINQPVLLTLLHYW